MSRDELLERLRRASPEENHFVICSVLGHCYLARSPDGRASLLVACSNSSGGLARTSGSLLIGARAQVTFAVDGRTWISPAVVIECLEELLVGTFVALALDVAEQLRAESLPTSENAFRALAGWERLLRSRATLSDESELGLWGEVLFILGAPSVDAAIRAWTPGSRGVIDFSGGGVGVEIKTSTSRLRHSVSHQQARSSDADLLVLFASIWAVPDAGGKSLADLVASITETTGEVVALEQKLLVPLHRGSDRFTRPLC